MVPFLHYTSSEILARGSWAWAAALLRLTTFAENQIAETHERINQETLEKKSSRVEFKAHFLQVF